ncbi:hypothetical protein FACS189434_07260 [Bacteroidia bacterium]|nr:hypothetical protein FACS189434_07260 [Bacteroidia bacterium]
MTFLKLIYVIYFILTVNTAGMLYATYKVNTYYTKRTNTNIQILSKSKKPVLINFGNNFSFKLKLDENKIKYKETMEKTGLSYLNCYIDSTNYVLESDFLKEK